jgi:hypothetical protein
MVLSTDIPFLLSKYPSYMDSLIEKFTVIETFTECTYRDTTIEGHHPPRMMC